MERLILFCFIGYIFISACTSPNQQSESPSEIVTSIPFDTLEKERIDSIMDRMHQVIRENAEIQKIPYTVYDPTDTIFFFILENNAARISLELNLETGIDWSTFYYYDGDLINVRYRYFYEDSISSRALEVITYLEKGKIVYCHERGNQLENGQTKNPGSIRSLPYGLSSRTPAEIQKDYQKTLKIVLDQMKEHDKLPSFLSSE